MKNRLMLIFCLMQFIIIALPAYTSNHWVQKFKYKEISEYQDTLLWLKLSLNGKYLYSCTKYNKIIKYDLETGDTIKSWQLKDNGNVDINTEDESVVLANQSGNFVITKKIILDSIPSFKPILSPISDPHLNSQSNQMGGSSYIGINAKFFKDCNSYIFYGSTHGQYNGWINYEYAGRINIFDSKTNVFINNLNFWGSPNSVAIGNNNLIAYSATYDIQYYRIAGESHQIYNNIYRSNNENVELKGGISDRELINNFSFSNDENYLLGISKKGINIWNTNTGNLFKLYTQFPNAEFYNKFFFINWTNKNDIFINSYQISDSSNLNYKSYMYFYNKNLINPIDSIVFSGNNQNYSYCQGPDSNSFFTISQGNVIRWFQPDILSNSLKVYFESDKNIVLQNDTISFTDASIGHPTFWKWDFGDSSFSNEQNPKHTWKKSGIYPIKLIIGNGLQFDTLVKPNFIKINSSLKSNFEADKFIGDYPFIVHFQNKSKGEIKSFLWSFGDGMKDSSENPFHIYKNPGIYPVSLIISDGIYFDTLTKIDYITVNMKGISDNDFGMEKMLKLENSEINGTMAFEGTEGNYIVEALSPFDFLYKFDSKFDKIWQKTLFYSPVHRYIQKGNDNIYYIAADYNTSNFNSINNDGTITELQKFSTSNLLFNFTSDSLGFTSFSSSKSGNWNYLDINRYDINNNFLWKKSINFSVGSYDYCNSIICSKGVNNNSLLSIGHTYSTNNSESYGLYLENIDNKGEISQLHVPNIDIVQIRNFNDLISLSSTSFIFLKDNSIYFAEENVGTKILFTPYASINKINLISLNNVIISGSQNGFCWYAIIDKLGNILEEHKLIERPGTFYSAWQNRDGSLLFSGVIYKNVNERYLYLYKTKATKINEIEPLITNQFDISPNPAQDILNISYIESDKSVNSIQIYNEFGEEVYSDYSLTSNQIDIHYLTNGVYFCRISANNQFLIRKFMVIK